MTSILYRYHRNDSHQLRIKLLSRWSAMVLGTAGFAYGSNLIIASQVGVAPWDVLQLALSDHLGWTLGTVRAVVAAVIILLAARLLHEPIRLGTFVCAFLISLFTDLLQLPTPGPQGVNVYLSFAAGLIILASGTAIYTAADLGKAPRDTLNFGLARATGRSIGHTRVAIELSVIAVGAALGGPVGAGTLVFGFAMGPMVQKLLRLLNPDVLPTSKKPDPQYAGLTVHLTEVRAAPRAMTQKTL